MIMSLFYRAVALGTLSALVWYSTSILAEINENSCSSSSVDHEDCEEPDEIVREEQDYRALLAFSLVICGTLLVTCVI